MSSSRAEAIVARARGLLDVPFRPQGRDPARGVDCVGLVATAADIEHAPKCYALRGGNEALLSSAMASAGLEQAASLAVGDVVALRTAPGQLHLGIWTGTSLVHADAGLRRVVERPGPLAWPLVSTWRFAKA
jgi:murein DD-endopeptidase / murein LD-carboxypeptidase